MWAQSALPKRIWNERGDEFEALRIVALPKGYHEAGHCPHCWSLNLAGAIIGHEDRSWVIDGADEDDPSLLCFDCGFWRD